MSGAFTHAAWTDALEDGALLGGTCENCGTTVGTPKAACPDCGTRDLDTVALPTEGVVYTETTINVPPAGVEKRGYQVAVVDLGPARVLGRLDEEGVEVGESVALAGYVEDEQGYAAPRFEAV